MSGHTPSAVKAFKELQSHRQRSLELLLERTRQLQEKEVKARAG